MATAHAFKGVLSITPTPFHEDGSLDLESIGHLVDFYAERGVDGITILGVFGEAQKLLPAERAQAIETFVRATADRFPVVVGTTHAGTQPAVALATQAEQLGAAGIMVAPPPLTGDDTDELVFGHFQAISDAVSIPIVVQDFPPASGGLKMAPRLLARMAASIEQVHYLKLEDAPSAVKTGRVREIAGDSLVILGGLGGVFFFEELQQGAAGTMTGFAYPEVLVDIYRLHSAGDVEGAAEMFYRYLPLIRFEFQPGIALGVRKEIYRRRGAIRTATARQPFTPLDKGTLQELSSLLARLQLN